MSGNSFSLLQRGFFLYAGQKTFPESRAKSTRKIGPRRGPRKSNEKGHGHCFFSRQTGPRKIKNLMTSTRLPFSTVGTKIIADPEKCFQELVTEKITDLIVG